MTKTIQTRVLLTVLLGFLLFGMAGAVFAKGSHSKIIGNVVWTSAPGVVGYQTIFNLHVDAPGKRAKEDSVVLIHPDGSERVMNVACTMIDGNEAWFAGEVTSADGVFAGQEGEKVIFWVEDNGAPGMGDADRIGATKAFADPCNKLGEWRGGGTVTDGNIKVMEAAD